MHCDMVAWCRDLSRESGSGMYITFLQAFDSAQKPTCHFDLYLRATTRSDARATIVPTGEMARSGSNGSSRIEPHVFSGALYALPSGIYNIPIALEQARAAAFTACNRAHLSHSSQFVLLEQSSPPEPLLRGKREGGQAYITWCNDGDPQELGSASWGGFSARKNDDGVPGAHDGGAMARAAIAWW
ncbi:hypothetical protein B0H17DRAFT_1185828 [Mycena rosella]|uniref:Uncharacterized protein n=1 Tax=Mycena rosella TaxID=1033263 RepID=A0AAD7G593_MYCRO|nr:hypothetical protein B0H17DRAFT_1185828 [Mycena rosella]